ASRSLPGTGQESVETITIDDYVASTGLSKVDFIKMDVEGGELQALKGAEQTIRQHRPKLAISVYHQPQDLFEIPGWITRVCPEYRLHLDHYTLFAEETVLYASTRGNM
ncbi:MAG: FkbM family methyltransferase, partial [Candidatus Sericytochromatia bacterium]|nr:FkbM family methyltransferase [Candidatus Sericytochromatia bacterium]